MARGNPSDFNKILLDAATRKKKESGTDIMTLDRWDELTYCMPLPHFVLQYMFSCVGVRFGGIYMIQGPTQSTKSPFLFWMLGYMARAMEDLGFGGVSWLSETENKLSTSLLKSFINKPYMYGSTPTFLLSREYTIDDMFEAFSSRLKTYAETYPEYNCPILQGIDSIGGSTTREVVESLQTKGSQGRGFSNKPIILTNWFDGYGGLVRDIPIITFVVNHEKPTIPQPGTPPGMTPRGHSTGGESQKFKASLNLRFSSQKFNNNLGNRVTIKTFKNSFGIEKKIMVDFVWDKTDTEDEVDAGQNHRWLWPEASLELLMAPPPYITTTTNLSSIIHIEATKDLAKVTSNTLGLKNVSPAEFESVLMNTPEVYNKIKRIFGIQDMQTFDKFLERKEEEAKPRRKSKQGTIDTIPLINPEGK